MKKYFLTVFAIFGLITSCNDNLDSIDIGPNYDRASLLENWFNNHINPSYNNFSNELSQFNSDVLDAKNNGLDEPNLEKLRNSFIKTYKAWRSNLSSQQDQLKQMGFSATFLRQWQYHLSEMAHLFNTDQLSCRQMLLVKQ